MSSPDNPQVDPQPPVRPETQGMPPAAPDPFSSPDAFHANLAPSADPLSEPPPIENPVWSGWDVLLIAALTVVVMAVTQLGLAKAAQLLWYPRENLLEAAQRALQIPAVIIASQFLVYIPVALLMVALVEGKYHVPFWPSIRWNWPRSYWKFLALGGAALLALGTLERFLPMPSDTPFEHLFDRPMDAYLLVLIATIFAPLLEELFFRGFMYPVIARRLGVFSGILLSALAFALLHLPQYAYAWAAGLVIFVVGLACGAVRAVTKSVAASFLVHVGYNGMQMLIFAAVTRGFTRMPKSLIDISLR